MARDYLKLDNGLSIALTVAGPDNGLPVVFLHGGGQTRHSWKKGVSAMARRGYRAYALDARGHGESDWDPEGNYSLEALVQDLLQVLPQLPHRPALVGASMGGITALAALADAGKAIARALILVDVTPRIDVTGAERIGAFMRASPDGFASLEEAAAAVAAYNPGRRRPATSSGLQRNLRKRNNRFYWHWDPAFLGSARLKPDEYESRLIHAAQRIEQPVLLVRGSRSEIVGDAEVAHFRELMPMAEYVDVKDAGHMVAGDDNDAFCAAILDFLERIDSAAH